RTIPRSGIVFRATLCFRLTRAPSRDAALPRLYKWIMRFQPAELGITIRAHRPPRRVRIFRRLRAEIVQQPGSLPAPALPIALRFSPPNIVSYRFIRSVGLLVPPTAINPDFAQALWTRWTWWTKWTNPFLSTKSTSRPLSPSRHFLSMSTYSASITSSFFFCSCPDEAPSPAVAPGPVCAPPLG